MKENAKVKCSFCKGEGRDPFGLLSPLATCQVCGGRGSIIISPFSRRCPFCDGTGVYPHKRNTCTVCGGTGYVSILGEVETCPECNGTGRVGERGLSCSCCQGKGVITKNEEKIMIITDELLKRFRAERKERQQGIEEKRESFRKDKK